MMNFSKLHTQASYVIHQWEDSQGLLQFNEDVTTLWYFLTRISRMLLLRFLNVASMEQVIWVFLLPAILYLLILIASHAHPIDPHHRLVFGRQIDV
ncbi:hypothetical protein NC653_029899 [Populus alba x Populus x berolinensis]|uniref:Uncharacterized protein n=1 Tax=Populus alba x Populus x berolinensis TaxID=444605 RepID=A0AAD6Q519_9ROSI|nr:hypothetical protein NC653_029899 [Populus alba x Populus x berolinensis]